MTLFFPEQKLKSQNKLEMRCHLYWLQGWLILFFTPTLATPAGVDIISRTPTLAPDAKAQALRVIAESPFLRERAQGLTWLPTPRPDIPH